MSTIQESIDNVLDATCDRQPEYRYEDRYAALRDVLNGFTKAELVTYAESALEANVKRFSKPTVVAYVIGSTITPPWQEDCTHANVRQISEYDVECIDCGEVSA